MDTRDQIPSIRDADLEGVEGGASRSSTQMTQALQTVTSSLDDLKRATTNNSNDSVSKLLPFVVMAKVIRGY